MKRLPVYCLLALAAAVAAMSVIGTVVPAGLAALAGFAASYWLGALAADADIERWRELRRKPALPAMESA